MASRWRSGTVRGRQSGAGAGSPWPDSQRRPSREGLEIASRQRGRGWRGRNARRTGAAAAGRRGMTMSTKRFDQVGSASPAERTVKDSAVEFPLGPHVPEKHGLFDPRLEKDSCGVGFIADIKGRKSHKIIEDALAILCNL